MKAETGHLLFSRLSLRKRLPLLIGALLLSAISIYGFANYYSLKKAVVTIGKLRLSKITNQISDMLGQSTRSVIKTANATAAQNTVVECLKSGGKKFKDETISALDKLQRDSTWISVELLNTNLQPIVRSDKFKGNVKVDLRGIIRFTKVAPNSSRVGKIYNLGGSMYYPVVSTVTDNTHNNSKQIIGYIISWQRLHTSQQAITSLSKLVGTGARFYLVNTDQSLRTDMIKPVANLPVKIGRIGNIVEYTNPDGSRMMAGTQIIPNTDWIIMVEFSEKNVLTGIDGFVNWIIIAGVILTAIGIFSAWVMSRNITKPLNQLTAAASAISLGDYSASVPLTMFKSDELGKLANAFNTMRLQVYQVHQNLENTVAERTSQLENANKELEAFSYSVSHDLRTPLRAIMGYSTMLNEDYDAELDAEGKRILRNIITNAKMMGQLIDDLLSFSRLGKKELVRMPVNMQLLTETVTRELLQQEPEGKYQINMGLLPTAEGDQVMIKQVLINLIGNAIKYSSKKADPQIEIGADDQETKTVYYIKDNGAGFDMAYAGKLFGVFQRLHSQEEFEGTGVGLALVKRIISKHRGESWAEGVENVGAAFYFSLPKN